MKKKIPIFEAKIGGVDDTGIYAISFVDYPANESNFVALARARTVKLQLNAKKQILTGVVLIPDQLIYRNDEEMGEYYLKFTASDIEKIANKMMRTGLALNNTTHQHDAQLKGNYLTELWTVTDPQRDKAVALGLGELPAGTLLASYKITDPTYWRDEVQSGNVKGFSLEGLFNFNSITMAKQVEKPKAEAKKPNGLVTFFKAVTALLEGETAAAADDLATVAAEDKVDAGSPFLIFELADGGEIQVDSDGFATLDGAQAPAGEHALADGNFIVIDDTGMMVVTQPETSGDTAAAPNDPVAMQKKVDAAKARAKAFLAKQGDPKAAKIAKLEKELAALKLEPSAEKAKTTVEATKDPKDMTYTEKMAAVIKSRRDRMEAKKSK